jgi:hypothetical protein
MSDWISVKERLPEDDNYALVSVLVSIDDGGGDPLVTIADYSPEETCFLDQDLLQEIGSEGCFETCEVTHWMPLPIAPPSITVGPIEQVGDKKP